VLGIIILLFAIAAAFSRGSYFAVLASLGSLVVITNSIRGRSLKRLIILASLLFVFAFTTFGIFGSNIFSERFQDSFDTEEGSNVGRIVMWETSFNTFTQNRFLGVGLGGFPGSVDQEAPYRSSINAHNTYLEIASEMGVLGFVFWVSVLGLAIFKLLKYIWEKRTSPNPETFLATGLLGSLIYFSIHSLSETIIYSPSILSLYLLVLAFSANIFIKEE